MRTHRRPLFQSDSAVSSVIGAILVTALVFSILLTIRISFVPVWEENAEGAYLVGVGKQISTIDAEIQRQVENRTASSLSNPLTLGQERASIFQSGASNHRLDLSTTGRGVRLDSNQLLVLSNNGTSVAGLNPAWLTVPSTGTVSNISRIDSLRVRITGMTQAFIGNEVNLTLLDRSNALVGFFRISAYSSQNDYVIQGTTFQAPATQIAEQANAQDKQTPYSYYFIDVLEPSTLFSSLLASATGPFTLRLSHSASVTADYTIAYAQTVPGGEILTGSAGTVRAPYTAVYPAGSLVLAASSAFHVSQSFILENGAVILKQADGQTFKVPPSFRASRTGNIVALTLSIPSLSGSATSLSGGSNVQVTTSASQNVLIKALAPRLQINVTTSVPSLWASYFDAQLKGASLDPTTTPPQYTITQSSTAVLVSIFGVTADPVSLAYDLNLTLKQAAIAVLIEG